MIPEKVRHKFFAGLQRKGTDECWPFEGGGHNKKGWHRLISHHTNREKKNYPAHRVAYALFVGPIGRWFVLHNCDNPVCCNPKHLFLGTQSDNAKDMWQKGRARLVSPKGRKLGPSPFRKIHDGDAVVAAYLSGHTQREIGKQLGCSDVVVSNYLRTRPEVVHLLGRGGQAHYLRRTKIKDAALVLRASGLTQYKTAERLGVSQPFISLLERE